MAMAGSGGGARRRSEGATPGGLRRSSRRLVLSAPWGGPPWPPLPRRSQGSPLPARPLTSGRSPQLRSQKENIPSPPPPPCAPSPPPPCAPSPPPPCAPSPPPSPPPAVGPRVRRSYSRLEPGTPRGPGGSPLSPIAPNAPPPAGPPLPHPALPGVALGPERRKRKKVAPIDLGELEAWAARMNAQFEEAERFRLVVE